MSIFDDPRDILEASDKASRWTVSEPRPMCAWSPYCYGDTKLFADKVRLENALKEAKNRFESILVLAVEGPDAWQNRMQLFQAIEKEAKLGYDALADAGGEK